MVVTGGTGRLEGASGSIGSEMVKDELRAGPFPGIALREGTGLLEGTITD